MEQNRDPRNKPKTYGQSIYDREVKNIQWRERQSFQQVVAEKLDSNM